MVEVTALLTRIASEVTLFRGMNRTCLERLLWRAERVSKIENELFFDEGEDGASFFVLLLGAVSVEKRHGSQWVELAKLQPGACFGEMTLIDDKIRSARVRALGDAMALYINNRAFENDHEILSVLYRNIARVQTRRLREFNGELAEFRAHRQAPASEPPRVDDEVETVRPAEPKKG